MDAGSEDILYTFFFFHYVGPRAPPRSLGFTVGSFTYSASSLGILMTNVSHPTLTLSLDLLHDWPLEESSLTFSPIGLELPVFYSEPLATLWS